MTGHAKVAAPKHCHQHTSYDPLSIVVTAHQTPTYPYPIPILFPTAPADMSYDFNLLYEEL